MRSGQSAASRHRVVRRGRPVCGRVLHGDVRWVAETPSSASPGECGRPSANGWLEREAPRPTWCDATSATRLSPRMAPSGAGGCWATSGKSTSARIAAVASPAGMASAAPSGRRRASRARGDHAPPGRATNGRVGAALGGGGSAPGAAASSSARDGARGQTRRGARGCRRRATQRAHAGKAGAGQTSST